MSLPRLKRLFAEVIRGVSPVKIAGDSFFIRHALPVESGDFEFEYERFFEEALSAGIQKEEDKHKYLIEVGLWSDQKESELKQWQDFIVSLNTTKSKLLLKSQIDDIKRQIKEAEITVIRFRLEKRELLGTTAESYASKKFNDFLIEKSFFCDIECAKPAVFESDIPEAFLDAYSNFVERFSEKNLKKIAIHPFFMHLLAFADNDVYKFYGEPIIKLTNFQIAIFSLGNYYKKVISEYGESPTEEMLENPDDFEERSKQRKNINEKLPDNEKYAQSIVGMTKEDRKRAGITEMETFDVSKLEGKSLEEIAKIMG